VSVSTQFYLDQAAECGRNARLATLPNQRDVLLTAQAAWQAMADRAIKTAAERERREQAPRSN
jgi:osmotically-inducible protein OsmY